jgi:hypothetical protein
MSFMEEVLTMMMRFEHFFEFFFSEINAIAYGVDCCAIHTSKEVAQEAIFSNTPQRKQK